MTKVKIAMLMLILCVAFMANANKQVRITVHAGATHKFQGLGASTNNRRNYQQIPEATQKEMARLMWAPVADSGMGFRVLRLWARLSDNDGGKDFALKYKKWYLDAKEQQPDLLVLLGPTGAIGDFNSYAQHYATVAKNAIDSGIQIDYTGIANEPNAHDLLSPPDTPKLIIAFRKALDALGLQKVKIIAPETSNVDGICFQMFDAILNDAEALKVLDGFSTHSYNMCVVKSLYDWVKPYGKIYWQTESSANGPEDINDSINAVSALSRTVSDINLGTNVWIWFLGYEQQDPNDNSTRIYAYDKNTGRYKAFLKHYYFRQFSRTFDVQADIRLSESNLHEVEVGGRDPQDRWMENWYGLKPSICAVAGRNPSDPKSETTVGSSTGDWAVAITNNTGIYSDWAGSYYYPAANYDVTIYFEELAGQSGKTFQVMRCNDGSRNVRMDDVVMQNGEITITAAPMDIICARENELKSNWVEPTEFPEEEDYGPCGVGVGFALLPPLGISGFRRLKKRANNKKK